MEMKMKEKKPNDKDSVTLTPWQVKLSFTF